MALAKNPVFHARTKHIDIRHHFIRENIERNVIHVIRIENMLAYIPTKGLSKEKHCRLQGEVRLLEL